MCRIYCTFRRQSNIRQTAPESTPAAWRLASNGLRGFDVAIACPTRKNVAIYRELRDWLAGLAVSVDTPLGDFIILCRAKIA
jgi:hypothetical protein